MTANVNELYQSIHDYNGLLVACQQLVSSKQLEAYFPTSILNSLIIENVGLLAPKRCVYLMKHSCILTLMICLYVQYFWALF